MSDRDYCEMNSLKAALLEACRCLYENEGEGLVGGISERSLTASLAGYLNAIVKRRIPEIEVNSSKRICAQAEVNKMNGFLDVKCERNPSGKLFRLQPDIIVHRPGTVDRFSDILICEVKKSTSRVVGRWMKDWRTLTCATSDSGILKYRCGVHIVLFPDSFTLQWFKNGAPCTMTCEQYNAKSEFLRNVESRFSRYLSL